MKKKLCVAVMTVLIGLGLIGAGLYRNTTKDGKLQVIDYKSTKNYYELSYQIDKYEDIEGVAWRNENEIITYIPNEEENTDNSHNDYDTCHIGVYNLKDKTINEFKNASVDLLNIGVSQDEKYAIYRKFDDGMKDGYENILNLENGHITDLKEFSEAYDKKCVGDNKMLISLGDKWKIINIEDKSVICEEKFQDSDVRIIGCDDIVEKDGDLQGKFYYEAKKGDKIKICTVNIKTKETKVIYEEECRDVYNVYKKADTIVLEKEEIEEDNNIVRPFSYAILDAEGNKIKEIEIKDETPISGFFSGSQLSFDGSKIVYIAKENGEENYNEILKVVDIKSGQIKTLADKSIFNSSEKSDNRMVQFAVVKWDYKKNKLMFLAQDVTQIPNDEQTVDEEGDRENFYGLKINKLDTYVLTFDE